LLWLPSTNEMASGEFRFAKQDLKTYLKHSPQRKIKLFCTK